MPVLSLECDELIEPGYMPFAAINFEMVVAMTVPMIFTGAKAACPQLVAGAEEFQGRVKKQCAAKKCPIGRVSDAMGTIQLEWMHQALGRTLHGGEGSDQIITMSNLPESLSSNKSVSSSMTPSFWVAGPHHESTNFEGHMFGSVRVNVSGSRMFACTDFGLWSTFARKQRAGNKSEPATADFADLASQSSNVTPLQARQLFRNLNSDQHAIFLLADLKIKKI